MRLSRRGVSAEKILDLSVPKQTAPFAWLGLFVEYFMKYMGLIFWMRHGTMNCASASWTAAVLFRFRSHRDHSKAPEDSLHYPQLCRAGELNPNGIPAQSPGVRGTSYRGKPRWNRHQPQRGCVIGVAFGTQPRWGWKGFPGLTQGSSCPATLGWRTQSFWDWPEMSWGPLPNSERFKP